jgi:hypothetical protein
MGRVPADRAGPNGGLASGRRALIYVGYAGLIADIGASDPMLSHETIRTHVDELIAITTRAQRPSRLRDARSSTVNSSSSCGFATRVPKAI